MNKRVQYLVEGITKDILAYLMEDNGVDLVTAITQFHNSEHLLSSQMKRVYSI